MVRTASKSKKKEENRARKKQHRRSARLAALKDAQQTRPFGASDVTQADDNDKVLDLEISLANPLPSGLLVGRKLQVPIVAVFSRRGPDVNPEELDGVWVFASLLDPDFQQLPDDDPLQGQRADSLHLLKDVEVDGRAAIAFAALPDLTFSKAGSYRLRLTTIDQRGQRPGRVLPAFTSEPFQVVLMPSSIEKEVDLERAQARLRQLGIPENNASV